MPQVVEIISSEFKSKLANGDAFTVGTGTPNLVGNVGDVIQAVHKVKAYWFVEATASDEIEVLEVTPGDPNTDYALVRSSGDWRDDGFSAGNAIDIDEDFKDRVFGSTWKGTVESISLDGSSMIVDRTSGTVSVGVKDEDYVVYANVNVFNQFDALFVGFGLIENTEPFNTRSKISNEDQGYYGSGFFSVGGQRAMQAKGLVKSWQTGKMNAIYDVFEDRFEITHEFTLNPVIQLGQDPATVAPLWLDGNASLKYVLDIEFRETLTSPNTIKTKYEGITGEVGWYNENFNGLANTYILNSIAYTDQVTGATVDGLQVIGRTSVVINLSTSQSLTNGDRVTVTYFRVPQNDDEVQNTSTDFEDNFIFDQMLLSIGSSVINFSRYTDASASIVGGDLQITFDFLHSAGDIARIDTDDLYVLAVSHHPSAVSADNSPRVQLLADYKNYSDSLVIEGLATNESLNLFYHAQNPAIDAPTSLPFPQWNEDGIYAKGQISIAQTSQLTSVRFLLLATDGTSSFELDSLRIPLSGVVVVNGTQRPKIDTTRGYLLPDGDVFNDVKFEYNSDASGTVYFNWACGFKIKWQDWIENPEVPLAFFDASKPNDNRNFKSSNYSDSNGYDIVFAIEVNTLGLDSAGRQVSGQDTFQSLNIPVYDYDQSDDGTITGATITFHELGTGNLLGSTPSKDEDCIMRCTWTGSIDEEDAYAIHRAQPNNSLSDNIQECSSVKEVRQRQLLQPKIGETGTTIQVSGSEIITECLVNHVYLNEEVWNFSAKLQSPSVPAASVDYDENDYETTNDYS